MSNPSRFDKTELLSGTAGWYFSEECLQPRINIHQCDIRLIDDKSPLLPNTKAILLLGQRAQSIYTGAITSLDENRGSPFIVGGIPCISSFSPQDAMDPQNFEARYNKELAGSDEEMASDEIDAGEIFESKGRGKTARSNYRFWLKKDCEKILNILENNGKIPCEGSPRYHIYPDVDTICRILSSTYGQILFFDMETDFISMDMRCFAFSFSCLPLDTYVVPVIDTNYKPAYAELPKIFKALRLAIANNTLVAHNGQTFDFVVLAYKYRIPINSVYDTMIAQKKIYPTIEKSLGHCVSLATYEPYHKNEGVHAYLNAKQAEQLYLYCGKDVYTMYLVWKWQKDRMAEDVGLKNSIELSMKAIKPYITMTLTGMKFVEESRKHWIEDNDFLMTFYMKCIQYLIGKDVEPLISNKKCVKYFHELLEYPVIKKSDKTNRPSLGGDILLKLKLQYPDNPVIDFLLLYREKEQETKQLNFKTYIPSAS